jgi:hypothetical protein
MATKNLAIVKPAEQNPSKQKPKRERVSCVEMRPEETWFLRSKTDLGREVWFLRLSVTGLYPRLYGPFRSKRRAVLFLDEAIGALCDCWQAFEEASDKYKLEGEFQHKESWGPLVEHPILVHASAHPKKGR